MPQQLALKEVLTSDNRDLGSTDWVEVAVAGAAPMDDRVVLVGGVQPDPHSEFERELDSFMTMTLIPQLMPQLLEITDATANVAVGVNNVQFTSSFEPGSRVRMSAVLISATSAPNDCALYTVGVTIEVEGLVGWAIAGEVQYLAGNP